MSSRAADTPRPSAGGAIWLIVRRELSNDFGTWTGYIVAALVLLIDGLFFVTRDVGTGERYSTDVLTDFVYDASGMTMVAAVILAMRLIAEERRAGTLQLLMNSSLSEGEIIFAKYLSALIFLGCITLISIYMPLMIFVRGKVSIGHIFSGYLGLLLLGSSILSIGIFASALARSQVVAAVIGGTVSAVLVMLWLVAKVVEGPLGEILNHVSLHNLHFRNFMQGTISSRDLVFYVSVTLFFLVLARNALESRRWSS